MKKGSKPVPKTPSKKAPATKPAAAKLKAKPPGKPKPRATQDQLELFPILKRLAQSAERLAQAAERLAVAIAPQPPAAAQEETPDQGHAALLPIIERLAQTAERLAEATAPPRTVSQQLHDPTGQPAEMLADLTTPGESVADLTVPAVDMPVDDATDEE